MKKSTKGIPTPPKRGIRYWLMKCEPEVFSITDLKKEKRARWGDIRNYQVRNMIRDEIQVGDIAVFYHSSTKAVGAVGEMRVIQPAYVDPTQFDAASHYYDPKATPEEPRWQLVDVQVLRKIPNITLTALRERADLQDMIVLKKGSRLSITPVDARHWKALVGS